MAALIPSSLHHFAIGPLIASEDFKWHVRSKRKDGTVTREEAETAMNDYRKDKKIQVQLNTDKVLAINESLGFCFKVEGRDDTYMFPALLPSKDLSVMWMRDESKKVYVGRRQVCSSQTTIFSPSVFGMFQSKVCATLDGNTRLWRDGLILSQGSAAYNFVECLVAMVDPVRSVDFVCRGGKATEAECVSLLDTVMSLWRDMLDRYSPGTEYQTEYLSRKHLEEYKELKQVAAFSQKKIEEAKATGIGAHAIVTQIVGDKEIVETLGELLVHAPSEQTVLVKLSEVTKAVIAEGSAQWYSFGVMLGFSHSHIDTLCHDKVTFADKLFAMIHVKTEQVGPLHIDDLLLEACGHLPNPIDGVVKEKLGILQQ